VLPLQLRKFNGKLRQMFALLLDLFARGCEGKATFSGFGQEQ